MKERFIIWHNADDTVDTPENTDYEYSIGKVLRVNSRDMYKCIRIDEKNDSVTYHFKQGIPTYNYDY
jgi:hypothetical protein